MPDFGTTPLSDTVLAVNTFPVCTVYVPNTAGSNLTATEGGPASTDENSKTSAPVSVYVKDGGDVTQGTSTDAANANTVIGQLKQIKTNTASVTIGSGTLTANIGTTGGLALDTSINGVIVAQGSTTSGQKGALTQGAVTSSAPTYTTAQTSPLSLTTAGALRVDNSANTQPVSGSVSVSNFPGTQPVSGTVTANAGSGTFTNQQSNITTDYDTGAGTQTMTMFGVALPASGGSVAGGTATNPLRTDPTGTTTQPISGTITANQGGSNWSTNTVQLNGTTIDTNSGIKSAGTQRVVLATDQPALTNALKVDGSAVTQPVSGTITANGGTGPFPVAGMVASGASNANNPVKVGGAFNTTQPTVTTGQVVDVQMTARGAQIVATGTDTFNVTANAGTNLNTSTLALESGGNLASAKADLDLMVPGIQGWIGATGTGTATTDDTLTFAQQVRKVYLHNASSVNVPFEFDTAAAATSDFIEPGQRLVFDDIRCTTVHVFPSALLPINTTNGLYVKGWK